MTDTTALDRAHAAMEAAPEDDTARLGFYERLADAELFLLLQSLPEDDDDTVTPELFDLGKAQYVLVFDREERLSRFVGKPAPFVALSGRRIAEMLAGQGIGLAVNPEVAPSSILLPAEAVDWLHASLGNGPDEVEARLSELHAPRDIPERLISAIDAKLATAVGLAQCAWLVGVTRPDGSRGHLLALVGALPHAENALADAMAEALTFSGIEAGEIDVGFFRADHPLAERLARVGLRFDLPQPETLQQSLRLAPGSDPSKPPILK